MPYNFTFHLQFLMIFQTNLFLFEQQNTAPLPSISISCLIARTNSNPLIFGEAPITSAKSSVSKLTFNPEDTRGSVIKNQVQRPIVDINSLLYSVD
jgi:uncharacterized protein YjiK